jgi:hypothetical protein
MPSLFLSNNQRIKKTFRVDGKAWREEKGITRNRGGNNCRPQTKTAT